MASKASEDGHVDITHLIQRCVTESLSYSHPFTPLVPPCSLPIADGSSSGKRVEVENSSGDTALMIQGSSSLPITSADDHADNVKNLPLLTQIDMREAMTALELGDERMDCCEISIITDEKLSSSPSQSTIPPRIAPLHLGDGTRSSFQSPPSATPDLIIPTQPITKDDSASSTSVPLKLQASPCPSLLPYWDTLSITSSSHQILPLLLLQLTSLEAFIGTNNGGSNAAETLYCMLWCHDGVLVDMRDKLSINNTQESTLDEATVAQWVLFASSVGVVRIAEAVRWAVVNADIYEEEDFGVAMHGVDDTGSVNGGDNEEQSPSQLPSSSPSTMRFCPSLKQEKAEDAAMMSSIPTYHADEYIDDVWNTALKHLREYASSREDTDGNMHDEIHALEIILRLQQSFYRSICRLSELNDQNVTDFTQQAKNRSRETVKLLKKLSTCKSVTSSARLVETDGRLRSVEDERLDSFLHASFDPFVNRRLLGNAPVRKARFCNTFKVIDSLSRVVSELEWAVCDVILEGNTLGRIMRMLENNSSRGIGGAFPSTTKPNNIDDDEPPFGNSGLAIGNPVGINILSRSLMLLNLYFDDKLLGQYDFPDMIGQHMQQICAVPIALLQSRFPGCGHSWLIRLAKPMYDTLKALCFDQHRERAFTEAFIFPAFASLQVAATGVDESFRMEHGLDSQTTASYASNYVIVQTIRVMERHVGIGIRIGLYPKWYDLSTAYWYRDFLLSALLNIRGSIEQERLERKAMELRIKLEEEEEKKKANAVVKKQISKKGKKKGKKKETNLDAVRETAIEEAARVSAEDFEDRLEYTSLTVHRYLCRGIVRYIAALRQAGLLSEPPPSITMFTSHQTRFEKRFESFAMLPQPQPLSFEDYMRGSDFSAVRSEDLVQSAGECFRSCKGVIERLLQVVVVETDEDIDVTKKRRNDDLYISVRREEAMALTKVCVANSLFLHKLSMAPSKVSEVSLEFTAHKEYCTLNLK
mmetsp:Transcript_6235/g.9720  ORF Transcript_6235/g.9720 Transcript_6235/m.9720 type:complete len:986 (-) Transcript_6235:45-3002(-)